MAHLIRSGVRVDQRAFKLGAGDALGAVRQRQIVGIELGARKGARQLHGEMDHTAVSPLVHAARADQGIIADQAQGRFGDAGLDLLLVRRGVILCAVVEVDQDVAAEVRLGRIEAIAVQTHAGRRCQLGLDALILQQHTVVAGRGPLAGVIEAGAIAALRLVERSGRQHDGTNAWDHQHIHHVAHARSAEVGVGEAKQGRIVEMIAGAGVPACIVGVGAELHHAERRQRAGKGVTVAARADEGVDVAARIERGRPLSRRPESAKA